MNYPRKPSCSPIVCVRRGRLPCRCHCHHGFCTPPFGRVEENLKGLGNLKRFIADVPAWAILIISYVNRLTAYSNLCSLSPLSCHCKAEFFVKNLDSSFVNIANLTKISVLPFYAFVMQSVEYASCCFQLSKLRVSCFAIG